MRIDLFEANYWRQCQGGFRIGELFPHVENDMCVIESCEEVANPTFCGNHLSAGESALLPPSSAFSCFFGFLLATAMAVCECSATAATSAAEDVETAKSE